MQKRRRRALLVLVLRKLLTCAICAIALVALLAVHGNVFHFSKLPAASESLKLPSQDIKYQTVGAERSRKQELMPPHSSKPPVSSSKLDDQSSSMYLRRLWKPPPNRDIFPCIDPSSNYTGPAESRGYLLVHTNGGLNQMRAGICDMVAVARILNATLVLPELDKRSFWQDTSNFSDVFDEEHFINALSNHVKVIKKLPKELSTAKKAIKEFISWSSMEYYQNQIAGMFEDYEVIRTAKSDSRLANNHLPLDIQKLRCRACYLALRFAPPIEEMGKLLVERMRLHGPYIALHLRYEKDMLAYSGCTHGLSPTEADELRAIRENTEHWKVKEINSTEQRYRGHCPLTPKEVGIFLTALGYPPDTPIYVAAGDIYGGNSHMANLQSRYPMLMSKEKLASVEELEPFLSHASQMAALDYIVSVESDVFVSSYSGNMARAVGGHRRFLGHRKTISPDRHVLLYSKASTSSFYRFFPLSLYFCIRKVFVRLVDKIEKGTLREGRKFSTRVIDLHRRRQGSPRKRKGPISGTKGMDRFRSEEAFYENPLPECLCRDQRTLVSANASDQVVLHSGHISMEKSS
ncbi:hypothetical protein SAY86_022754 [Trapa natans]|uniref:O-fucosyltransferase family protein n=1 Tax=Trapa natans TaxID=22666 RepID=A0AAN7R4R4_TRANT|nr:hypothetical protein SAY86_022754 [Trapa natans]